MGSEVLVMCDSFGLSVIDHQSGWARVRDRARYRGFGSAGKEDYNLKVILVVLRHLDET